MKEIKDFVTILSYLIIVSLTIIAGVYTLEMVNDNEIKEQTIYVLPISSDCLLVTNYFEFIQQDTCEYRPVIVEVTR